MQTIVDFCNENGNTKPRYSIQTDMVTLKILSRAENKKLAAMDGNGSNNY